MWQFQQRVRPARQIHRTASPGCGGLAHRCAKGVAGTSSSTQAHQWAEVAFEDYGWITFEPTASGSARTRLDLPDPDEITFGGLGFDDSRDSSNTGPVVIDAGPRVFNTVTDITRWPSEVVRGEPFTIGGIVETQGGVPVTGMEVEIFVNEIKANGGLQCRFRHG